MRRKFHSLLVLLFLLVSQGAVVHADHQPSEHLAQVARKASKAVLMVGSPKSGYGTAFVISKKHRLLATNAHIGDIYHESSGKMFAILNGSSTTYKVIKVYYHPKLLRWKKDGKGRSTRVISMDPKVGRPSTYSPDLAVLQLSLDGPDLPSELPIAGEKELHDLLAASVGMLGFPGHDNRWPKSGESVSATYYGGTISRLTGYDLKPAVKPSANRFVQYTMRTWGGYSGSPVFSATGHVVAIHNSVRVATNRKSGVKKSIAHGIRADALLDLLKHHGLVNKVPKTGSEKRTVPTHPIVRKKKKRKPPSPITHRLTRYEGSASDDGYVWVRKSNIDDILMRVDEPERWTSVSFGALGVLQRDAPEMQLPLTDIGLARLCRSGKITRLDISSSQITDSGLRFVSRLKNLEALYLKRCSGITDDGLIHLSNLKRLSYLYLNGTNITDEGLKHLAGLPRLRALDLSRTRVTDRGMSSLARSPSLSTLYLNQTQVGDAGLLKLLKTDNGHSLDLHMHGTRLTDKGLEAAFGDRPQMRAVQIEGVSNCHVGDDGVRALVRHTRYASYSLGSNGLVYRFNLANTDVSPHGLKVIVEHSKNVPRGRVHYYDITVGSSRLTDDHLRIISQIRNLRVLRILDGGQVTDAGLKHLAEVSGMEVFELDGGSVTDAGLRHLARMSELRSFRVANLGITNNGLKHLAVVFAVSPLEALKIENCPNITDEGLAAFRGVTTLQELSLAGTNVTDVGLLQFKNLKIDWLLNLSRTRISGRFFGSNTFREFPWQVILQDCSQLQADHLADCRASYLDLSGSPVQNGKALLALFKYENGKPKYGPSTIVLRNCKEFGNEALAELNRSLPTKLRRTFLPTYLILVGSGITEEGYRKHRTMRSYLDLIWQKPAHPEITKGSE